MRTSGVILLNNAAATGAAQRWPGGRGMFVLVGTIGGSSIAFEFQGPDSTTWLPVQDTAGADVTLTAVGSAVFELPPCPVRATVTGGAPAGLYASAARIPE